MNLGLKWLFKSLGFSKHHALIENKRFFYDLDWKRPLQDYDFVVFDTELTGLEQRNDEIVSIGAVRVHNLRIAVGQTFFCYARPSKPLPKDSTLIHRITPDQIIGAQPLEYVLPDFVNFLHGAVIVGHFVSIDISFLNRATKSFMGGVIKNPFVDTMKMAQYYEDHRRRRFYEDAAPKLSFSLNDLSKKYGLPLFEKHDALEDAMQTAYLFLFLMKKFKSLGVSTLKDLFTGQKKAAFSSDQDSYSA
ncbi:MAG: 3'-5' exonuclease [Pseudomonadota bacterium]